MDSSNLRQRHLSTASDSSSTSSSPVLETPPSPTLKTLSKLLHWDDLPHWRRDNAYLLTSYRHPTPTAASVLWSVLTLHNETVNIWTHLLGSVLFFGVSLWAYALVKPRYETSADSKDVLVFSAFFAGAVACLGMSATYHAVSSHSEQVARVGNKLDYAGIVVLTVGSFVPALYYGLFCRPVLMVTYMSMIGLLGLGCALFATLEKFRTPAWRPYRTAMFVGLGLSGVVPVVHGLIVDGYQLLEERMGLSYVLLEAALYIGGAGLYVLRWPERSFPHTFDILGSSHQIFHVCVVSAAVSHLYGMARAFDHHHSVMGATCT